MKDEQPGRALESLRIFPDLEGMDARVLIPNATWTKGECFPGMLCFEGESHREQGEG